MCVSLLETVKDQLHITVTTLGEHQHLVLKVIQSPGKERTDCCHFFIRLQMDGCKVFELIKSENAWSDQMTKRFIHRKKEKIKRETGLSDEQLINEEVMT